MWIVIIILHTPFSASFLLPYHVIFVSVCKWATMIIFFIKKKEEYKRIFIKVAAPSLYLFGLWERFSIITEANEVCGLDRCEEVA